MLLWYVTWWKKGQVTSVIKCHLWALRGCANPSHTACMERGWYIFTGKGDNCSHEDQKWPPRAEVVTYVFTQGVHLFAQFLSGFLQWSYSCLNTGINLICTFYLSIHRNKQQQKQTKKIKNVLICFENFILTSKHCLLIQTHLLPF